MRPFRLLVAVLVALAVSTPAAAQFKKLKDAASKAAEQKAATSAPARQRLPPGRPRPTAAWSS